MKNLADYIMAIDDVLSEDFCTNLIQKFDSESHVIRDSEWDQDYKSFNELSLDPNKFKLEIDHLYEQSKRVLEVYKKHCNINFFPKEYGYEAIRMKKYLNNNKDQFGWHTDVGDYQSARRFLVMFYYLNDVQEGGETIFQDKINSTTMLKVQPKRGRIMVFPPMWMYPHKGAIPISNSKYIVSTYCHYL